MEKIGIIGAGWLGKEIARYFSQRGYQIHGTTKSAPAKKGYKNFSSMVQLNVETEPGSLLKIPSHFRSISCFILAIPPSNIENYAECLTALIAQILQENERAFFFFTSSISVYGDRGREVDETSSVDPKTIGAKRIVQLEEKILTNKWPVAILRLGGLVGPARHPVYSLSGKTGLLKAQAAVNLIHSEDVANAIHYLIGIKQDGIYNLCAASHPSKSEFYTNIARRLNIEIPVFNTVDKQKDKVVLCKRLTNLNFQFRYSSPYDFPL